jgi:CheY-like chemotaxis protein
MTQTVVITDDDPVTVFMHNLFVKKSGLTDSPVSFSNAMDTLEYLAKHEGPMHAHLILLDINMPGMSGWDLLSRINENKFRNVNVVIVSSSVNTEDREKADVCEHVIGFLEKPLSNAKIQALMESKRYRSVWKPSS